MSNIKYISYYNTYCMFSDNPPPPVANSTTECPKQKSSSTATSEVAGEVRAKKKSRVFQNVRLLEPRLVLKPRHLLWLLVSQQSSREPRVFQKPGHLLWLLVSQQSSRVSKTKASPVASCKSAVLKRLKAVKGISKWKAESPVATHKSARAKEFSKVKASTSKSKPKMLLKPMWLHIS